MSLPSRFPQSYNTFDPKNLNLQLKSIFWLIESLVPLDYCIQHKILPLVLIQNCLTLGIVNQDDRVALDAALDNIYPILNSHKYTLKLQCLELKTYHSIVSEYIKHSDPAQLEKLNQSDIKTIENEINTQQGHNLNLDKNDSEIEPPKNIEKFTSANERTTLIVEEPEDFAQKLGKRTLQHTSDRRQINERTTIILDPLEEENPQESQEDVIDFSPLIHPKINEQKTIIVDTPKESRKQQSKEEGSDISLSIDTQIEEIKTLEIDNLKVNPKTTQYFPPIEELDKEFAENSLHEPLCSEERSSQLNNVNNLTPHQLWQELMDTILQGGIGEISLEQNEESGSLICTQNGILCLSFNNVTPQLHQGLLQELKEWAQLPPVPVFKLKKLEIEQFHDRERLLICLQFSPSKYGEEAKLQVLRGKALEFYQQKQIDEIGQEALQYARKLERKLKQINNLSQINPSRLNALSSLQEMHAKIEEHLKLLSQK